MLLTLGMFLVFLHMFLMHVSDHLSLGFLDGMVGKLVKLGAMVGSGLVVFHFLMALLG